ncbi:MAG: DUF6267 family protein [Bacteroidales bacterium]|nr:DUF6267 family protein [Bacteroidales bacterium]
MDEAVNKHSTHIADSFIMNGQSIVPEVLNSLQDIVQKLKSRKAPNITVKVDGAPALFVGYINNKFFVASKGIFNKEPKINFSNEDLDRNHSGGLGETMKYFLKYLNGIVPNDGKVYQGDVLYTSSSLMKKQIDGCQSYCWQPNTILYSVPEDSPLGQQISSSKCGICFHTRYSWDGSNPSTLNVVGFDVKKEMFKKTKDVVIMDPFLTNIDKEVYLSPDQEAKLKKDIATINSLYNKIDYAKIQHQNVQPLLMIYINSFYKGNTAGSAQEKARGFEPWVMSRMELEKGRLKTDKARANVEKKYDFMKGTNWEKVLVPVFQLHNALESAKMTVKSLLDRISVSRNFLVRSDGSLVATGHEGYVITSGSPTGMKIVSRSDFSLANFSSSFRKGWDH